MASDLTLVVTTENPCVILIMTPEGKSEDHLASSSMQKTPHQSIKQLTDVAMETCCNRADKASFKNISQLFSKLLHVVSGASQ